MIQPSNRDTVDGSGEFFIGVPQEEALARLHYLIDAGRSLGIVGGDSGCGKTWTLVEFASQARRRGYEVAYIEAAGRDGRELLHGLADALGTRITAKDAGLQLWRAIRDRLIENRLQRLHTVLVFDHVEETTAEALALIARLLHETDIPDARLTFVVAGTGIDWSQVAPRILERAELKVELDHWSLSDVERFGGWRAARGGVAWEPEAIAHVWRVTQGRPRAVRRLIELAQLAVGSVAGERVSAQVVNSIRMEILETP